MSKKNGVYYTASALKDLRKLDRKDAKKITETIAKYTEGEPLLKSKALTGVFDGLYRYRIGNYRAVFEYDDSNIVRIVTILRIKHRKDIYKK